MKSRLSIGKIFLIKLHNPHNSAFTSTSKRHPIWSEVKSVNRTDVSLNDGEFFWIYQVNQANLKLPFTHLSRCNVSCFLPSGSDEVEALLLLIVHQRRDNCLVEWPLSVEFFDFFEVHGIYYFSRGVFARCYNELELLGVAKRHYFSMVDARYQDIVSWKTQFVKFSFVVWSQKELVIKTPGALGESASFLLDL